jgi:hypothetical protein
MNPYLNKSNKKQEFQQNNVTMHNNVNNMQLNRIKKIQQKH